VFVGNNRRARRRVVAKITGKCSEISCLFASARSDPAG